MPTNLPPDYFRLEEQFREAADPQDKITYLEEMMSVIPKHKGTDHLRAELRRKISKLRETAQSQKGRGKQQVSPYHFDKEGAGQIAVIGPPNTGKSSLVGALTNTKTQIAPYPFATQQPVAGMMPVEDVQIQLIDTPPLSPDFDEPQLYDLIRRVDLLALVIDLRAYPIEQYEDALALLEARHILPERRRDAFPLSEQARYTIKPMMVLVNMAEDMDEDFEVLCELLGEPAADFLPVSAKTGKGLEIFKRVAFERLEIVRVYSKPPGEKPDLEAPYVLKSGSTVEELAGKVHRDFLERLSSARIWGKGVFDGQKVGRDHVLQDGDVVELRM